MILAGDYIPKAKEVALILPSELILANLEAPVIGDKKMSPILKSGPSLFNRSLGTDKKSFVFSLANNHMMDFGEEGLAATLSFLDERGIPHCGAGFDQEDARKPVIVNEAGKKIAVFGCRERQFGSAEARSPGCADMGLWLLDAVRNFRSQMDFIIVSCHAAFEHSPFPSPSLREYYHHLIDAGADIIHGHHAHIPQGWEEYHDGLILYGLGNFVVDPASWAEVDCRWSLYARVDFRSDRFSYSIGTLSVLRGGLREIEVKPPLEKEKRRQEHYLGICNAALKEDDLFIGCWQEVCVRLFDKYYGMVLRVPGMQEHRLTFRNKIRHLYYILTDLYAVIAGKKFRSRQTRQLAASVLNSYQCESHSDVIVTACGVLLGVVCDKRSSRTATEVNLLLGE